MERRTGSMYSTLVRRPATPNTLVLRFSVRRSTVRPGIPSLHYCRGSSARAVIAEVIEKRGTFLVFHLGAPARHFGDFAIPLRARETLLAQHVVIVTGSAGGLEGGRLWHAAHRCRRLRRSRKLLHHIHARARNDIPQVP